MLKASLGLTALQQKHLGNNSGEKTIAKIKHAGTARISNISININSKKLFLLIYLLNKYNGYTNAFKKFT